jgi:cellulose synthase/poly-beta-1,6-N-acetylglucosamine synthase-like glycosyltransferase
MGTLAAFVFVVSGALLVYTYLGYPLLLHVIARPRRGGRQDGSAAPSVSVIVAAFNEERCIRAKIDNILAQAYPAHRVDVVVVSDRSTDGTDELVRTHPDPRVRLLVQRERGGKNLALNRGVHEARGDVVVFTDADAMLAPHALATLVAPFGDAAVGLVSGQGLYGELGDGTTRVVSNAYVRYESFIKQREAALGFVAAADGALYAMRRSAYRTLAAKEVHDLVHPIQVALAGWRSAFEPDAFTVEPPSVTGGGEFRRHVRIIAQGFVVLIRQLPVLLAAGRTREAWMLVSHRLLRWASSLFLAGALVGNAALAKDGSPLLSVTLAGQLAFYALAAAGAIGERFDVRLRLLAIPYFFCLVSAAGVTGFLQFLRGQHHATWLPSGTR